MPVEPPPQMQRARVMTRALRSSPSWSSFRADLAARGLEPDEVILIDACDDEEGIDVGLLATADQRLIAWRREYDDETDGSRILEWQDVSDGWAGTRWGETAAAYVQALRNTRTVPAPGQSSSWAGG